MDLERIVRYLDEADNDLKQAQARKYAATMEATQELILGECYDLLKIDIAKMRRLVYRSHRKVVG